MDNRIAADDLATRLSDVLDRVQNQGERFLVERGGEPVASLVPPPMPLSITLRQVASHLAQLALPDDGFAADLEAIQSAQPPVQPPEWPN